MGAKLDIRRAGGLTLIEMLVVVGIIAIMAGIAIPSFARMGLLWKNDLQSSARELYTLLRAARIYATTYNVETAVVYMPYNPEGETANNLRAAAMMYGYTYFDDERREVRQAFHPVARQDDGSFRSLPGETCLVFPATGIEGAESVTVPENVANANGKLLAHVFEPSGRLRKDGKELYRIDLRYDDAASPDEMYVDPLLGGDPDNPNDDNVRKIGINFYRATGRVEIASD